MDVYSFDIISQIYLTNRSRKVDESSKQLLSLLPSFAKDLFWKMNRGIVLSSRSLSIIPSVRGKGIRSLSLSLSPLLSCTARPARNNWTSKRMAKLCRYIRLCSMQKANRLGRLDPLSQRRDVSSRREHLALLLPSSPNLPLSLSLSSDVQGPHKMANEGGGGEEMAHTKLRSQMITRCRFRSWQTAIDSSVRIWSH